MELTTMQAAYWAGRDFQGFLGGVAAHLYAEFDGRSVCPNRLRHALERLLARHAMLRLRVSSAGLPSIQQAVDHVPLEVEDLRGLTEAVIAQRLLEKRRMWTGRKLDLARDGGTAFGLSLLPGEGCRLHVDADMIAVDPDSFRVLMEDLARFYEDPEDPAESAPGFFDLIGQLAGDPDLALQREVAKTWWRDRLGAVPPAPPLPLTAGGGGKGGQSERFAERLSCGQRRALEQIARNHRMTISTLMLGLFAEALGRSCDSNEFRLNVPMFWRPPAIERVEEVVGEFSNVLILGVDLGSAPTLAALCRNLGNQMIDLLAHSAYPGVNVMRDLSRHHGSMQASPVVFTSGLDLSGGDLFTDRVARVFGQMNWVISQAPHIALDAQVAEMDGGILINWDVRMDALDAAWVEDTFDCFVSLVREVAARPDLLDELPSAANQPDESKLTQQMLMELLTRLEPGSGVHPDTDFEELRPASGGLDDLMTFINRYVPAARLRPEDIETHRTPERLAKLICDRSSAASEDVSRSLLEAMDVTA